MKRLIFLMLALLVAGSVSAATKVQVMTDGVIDVDRLPTISFFQETDPTAPELGQLWWNNATNQLKIAGTLGVYSFNATNLVNWDTTPAAFSFTDVVNATTNSTYTSSPITASGINWPAAISVSGDASAKYSVNGGTAVSTAGTVEVGDAVRAVVTSSASASTAVNSTVTIGGVSDAFSVTTAAATSEYTYIGWPTESDGEIIGAPNSTQSLGVDVVATTRWVATESGTASAIKVKLSTYSGTVIYSGAVLYKDIGGIITLIGHGAGTLSATGWSDYITITAVPGQSLDFESGDVLYFGTAVSSSGTIGIARNDAGGSGGYYVSGLANFTEPPSTVTFTFSASRLYALALRYE